MTEKAEVMTPMMMTIAALKAWGVEAEVTTGGFMFEGRPLKALWQKADPNGPKPSLMNGEAEMARAILLAVFDAVAEKRRAERLAATT